MENQRDLMKTEYRVELSSQGAHRFLTATVTKYKCVSWFPEEMNSTPTSRRSLHASRGVHMMTMDHAD